MPNHITTIIKARPEVILNLTRRDEKEGIVIDFNNIIPKPSLLDEVVVDGTEYIVNHLFGEDKGVGISNSYFFDRFLNDGGISSYNEQQFENFIAMIRNKRDYGETSWYGWSVKNWGTKWGAYDYNVTEENISDGIIQFDTAWSTPMPVIVKLSEFYPDDEIEVKYADEDIGSNFGHFRIKNGEIIEKIEIFDPILFALTIKGDLDDSPWYVLNTETGKYEYNEKYEEE